MTEDAIAVEARAVSKRYGSVWALRDCAFQLPANRIIALVGANGAGKSTLMSIISGMLAPTAGSLLVHDRPVAKGEPRRRREAGSRSWLRTSRCTGTSARPTCSASAGPPTGSGTSGGRCPGWNASTSRMDRRCGKLSGGQRAQVALAVALGSQPAVLLLDEPLANLDPVARTEVTGELMAEAGDSDMTVMLSTHIVAELSGVGDHLLLLDAGRAVLTGDVEDLLAGHVRLSGPRADLPPGPGHDRPGAAHRPAVHVRRPAARRHRPRRPSSRPAGPPNPSPWTS